jgi:hypothetical protein
VDAWRGHAYRSVGQRLAEAVVCRLSCVGNLREAFLAGEVLTVDLLYGDHEGGRRTISRFVLTREQDGSWRPSVVRHWPLEGVNPRGR